MIDSTYILHKFKPNSEGNQFKIKTNSGENQRGFMLDLI